ncbi:MAG: FIST N-terminal domain-containing protein [Candidatus Eisenbacteria bacterium]
MKWASAQSQLPDAALAAGEAARTVRDSLGEGQVDLAMVFFTAAHRAGAEAIASVLRERLAPGHLAGVSARGVVTREHELEQGPALSLIAARLPGVQVRPFLLTQESWREQVEEDAAFDLIAPGARGAEIVLFMGDPHSLDVERVLAVFNRFAPGVRVVGGLASAGHQAGENVLLLNDWLAHEGGFALALHGAIRADVVVSQGCEPLGPPLDVTHVEGNIIVTLDGQPALERAEQVLREVPEEERGRLGQGLYVGRPVRGDASGRGDYLIRNLLGADRERGAIAVGDIVKLREKIRLHVRDARAALSDLEMLLSPQAFDTRAKGVLLFACNGRGQMLHGAPDRDVTTLQDSLGGGVPCAGMFCAGEVGPVGERNFLHGHTASIAILRPR